MTKQIFANSGMVRSVLGVGGYPTHSVVGVPADFYVYVAGEQTPWSGHFKGAPERHSALKRLHVGRDREGFVRLVETMWKEQPHDR